MSNHNVTWEQAQGAYAASLGAGALPQQTVGGPSVQATSGPHVCTTGCSWPCPWAGTNGPHFAAAQPLTLQTAPVFAPPLSNPDVDRIARRVVDLLRESKAHIPVTNRDNGIRHDEGEG